MAYTTDKGITLALGIVLFVLSSLLTKFGNVYAQLTTPTTSPTTTPLHVLLLVLDDFGIGDLATSTLPPGSTPTSTPFLSHLLSPENHRTKSLSTFTPYPQCTPSRASLLTGKRAENLGMSHYVLVHGQDYCLPSSTPTLMETLPENYKKVLVGKWHLGHSRKSCLPTSRGFDEFHGYYLGSIDFYGHDNSEACCCEESCGPGRSFDAFNSTHPDVHDLDVKSGEYITDSITRSALSSIESFDPDSSTSPSSLFLTVAMAATHNGPFGDPQFKKSDVDPDLASRSERRAGFNAMAKNLDENVKRLYDKLDEKNMLSETLIIILSDNGGETSSGSSVYPYRGQKFTYFNGGIRSPAAIHGAGVEGGGALDGMFWIGDMTPTILEAIGAEVPKGLDGLSHWGAVSGQSIIEERGQPFVSGLDPVRRSGAVFFDQYKLVVNGTAGYDVDFSKPEMGGWVPPDDADSNEIQYGVVEEFMLFDLRNDEEERVNLAGVEGFREVLSLCVTEFSRVMKHAETVEQQAKNLGGALDEITPGAQGYGPWVG